MPIMHEMAVTESILGIVVRHAQRAGARRVVGINLVIGDLTGFIDESIQFYFDFLSRETVAHGAELRFERVAARVGPIATTSANRHGEPTPVTAESAAASLTAPVAVVVDGGALTGAPSTVVDTVASPWRILRRGGVVVDPG